MRGVALSLVPSGPRVIAKMDHSIIETALVQGFQHYADVDGQERLAAADDDRRDEQMILVEAGPDRVRGESGANIMRQLSLPVANDLVRLHDPTSPSSARPTGSITEERRGLEYQEAQAEYTRTSAVADAAALGLFVCYPI
jgi:hypothetical protein